MKTWYWIVMAVIVSIAYREIAPRAWSRSGGEEMLVPYYVDSSDGRSRRVLSVVKYGGDKKCVSIYFAQAAQNVGKTLTLQELAELERTSLRSLQNMIYGEFDRYRRSPLCKDTWIVSNFTFDWKPAVHYAAPPSLSP